MRLAVPRGARHPAEADTGVYLLANDGVLGWLTACAASLREFNPDVRVVVIPYDGRLRGVRRLCRRHGFELLGERPLRWLDRLGVEASTRLPPQYLRKLAAFWGPLDRFLYLDVDTVVLMDVRPLIAAVAEAPGTFWFGHSGRWGGNLDEVYRAGPWRERFLQRHGSHYGNSGVWAAARDAFTVEQIKSLAVEARPLATSLTYADQAFLNYCLDTTGTPVRNLHELGGAPLLWAGVSGGIESDGGLSIAGEPVGLVHWAGLKLNRRLPYRATWEHWAGRSASRLRIRTG